MADVFVSYSREDKARAAQIVRLLEDDGWDVFWDQETRAGTLWPKVLEQQIDAAACLVALWTAHSIDSRWVRIEAYEALQGDKLLPLLLDEVRLPLEFRHTQTIDLSGWTGDRADPRIARVLADLRALVAAQRSRLERSTTDASATQSPIASPIQTRTQTCVPTLTDDTPTAGGAARSRPDAGSRPTEGGKERSRARARVAGIASVAVALLGIAAAWHWLPAGTAEPPKPSAAADAQSMPPAASAIATTPATASQPLVQAAAAPGPQPLPASAAPPVPVPTPVKVVAAPTLRPGSLEQAAAKTGIASRCLEISEKFQSTGQITAAERDLLRGKECQP